MAIIAPEVESNFTNDIAPAGAHVARCISIIHIGTAEEDYKGVPKRINKIRITWELPNETKVWREGEEAKPYVISSDYTLAMSDNANLRKLVDSWRGKRLTEGEARVFDVAKLAGAPCMINIIHNPSKKDPSRVYANVTSVTPIVKGLTCPPAINEVKVLDYDNFDWEYFSTLPDFIKERITKTEEWAKLNGQEVEEKPLKANEFGGVSKAEVEEELPF